MKLQVLAGNFTKKETLTQVFFCEFCKIFKNTFFTDHPLATASDALWFSLRFTYFANNKMGTATKWCFPECVFPKSTRKIWRNWFLKLVSVIYQIFIFSPNDNPSKTIKNVFLFYRKSSFRSRDIQVFVFFSPSFPHCPDSKGQMNME